jgi:hypothetical protein
MGRQTFLWLVAGAALLAGVVLWQREREQELDLGLTDVALFEGLRSDDVRAFFVDHLERGMQLKLERDARGIWYITDPILFPADTAVVSMLLETVTTTRALLVPRVERDARRLGLDPPRARFTVEEERGGVRRRHSLLLGHIDLDGKLVNVLKDGRYLRILRNLDSTLKRGVNEFRSPRVLQIGVQSVHALNRWGSLQEDLTLPPRDLRLNAVRDGEAWRSLLPFDAALDPLDFSVLLYGACGLRVERFVEEESPALGDYGLDAPLFWIELLLGDDVREELYFGQRGRDWYVRREGLPHVFGIAAEDMARLWMPFEELVESRLLRVLRAEVQSLELESPARELRLLRQRGGWSVALRARGESDFGPAFPAEPGRVASLLGELEDLELLGPRPGEPFPEEAPPRAIRVVAAGQRHGGRIGPEVEGPDGSPACWFQRDGDEILSLAPRRLLELCDTGIEELRALDLALTAEIQVLGLELSREGAKRRFQRNERGRWSEEGSEEEFRPLLDLLDSLLFLRASAHEAELRAEDLEQPVQVRFDLRPPDEPVVFRVGRVPRAGEGAFAERLGAVARLKQADLHARLWELLGG